MARIVKDELRGLMSLFARTNSNLVPPLILNNPHQGNKVKYQTYQFTENEFRYFMERMRENGFIIENPDRISEKIYGGRSPFFNFIHPEAEFLPVPRELSEEKVSEYIKKSREDKNREKIFFPFCSYQDINYGTGKKPRYHVNVSSRLTHLTNSIDLSKIDNLYNVFESIFRKTTHREFPFKN